MVKNAKEEMTRAERIFVRINVAQTVLAVAGLFTGAVALFAALNESEAVRRQAAAAVWPFVQILISDTQAEGAETFTLTLANAGVGPARIVAVRLSLDGRAASDWADAIETVLPGKLPKYGKSTVRGRVLRAGESVDLVSTTDADLVRALGESIYSGKASIEYCYCSIFNECWIMNSKAPIEEPHRAVKKCPDYGDERFGN